jgi:hypothetical protein
MSQEVSNARAELDAIYLSLDEAKAEIQKRWNDKELRLRMEALLGDDLPAIMKSAPRAVISRHVMSPNFELLNFLKQVENIGIEPAGLEYLEDKFVTINEDKYYLGKMFFYEGIGKKGGVKTSSIKIVDFDFFDGKKILEVKTLTGDGFVDFHHQLVSSILGPENRMDMSEYYARNGGHASRYYRYILSLFICHGVLFENFLLSGFYSELTTDIFLPTYKEVVAEFGVRPLVVRLVPGESEEDLYWRQYPAQYKDIVSGIMKGMGQTGHIKT